MVSNAPAQEVDDLVWEMHHPGAKEGMPKAKGPEMPKGKRGRHGKGKRSTDDQMSLDEIEENQLEYDQELNLKSLHYAFDQLKVDENTNESNRVKRTPSTKRMMLTLNVGAFIRKAIRSGQDKTMSTYWSYKGSLTTPSEY